MTGTAFYFIDDNEQRYRLGHMGIFLDDILSSLHEHPTSLEDLNEVYQKKAGEELFESGNYPKIPEDLSIESIRSVLGMFEQDEKRVLDHWNRCNAYKRPNYQSMPIDESDISELDDKLFKEWQSSPYRDEYPTLEDYRREEAPGNGIVIVDLRSKVCSYLSSYFDIPEEKIPDNWTVIRL
jgi:hypothetical protein